MGNNERATLGLPPGYICPCTMYGCNSTVAYLLPIHETTLNPLILDNGVQVYCSQHGAEFMQLQRQINGGFALLPLIPGNVRT